ASRYSVPSTSQTVDPSPRASTSSCPSTLPIAANGCQSRVVAVPSAIRSSCSADADQLLVDELVGSVAAELASEAGAFRAAERQLGSVRADDVHVDHAGVDLVRDALGLLWVIRHHVRAERSEE